jgi:hypothetical protein
MTASALMIFCLLALAALSAIGLFALTGSVPNHGGIQPISTGDPPPVKQPYSPPRIDQLQPPAWLDPAPAHAHHCQVSKVWHGIVPPSCTCNGVTTIAGWPTFQEFYADSADAKITGSNG